jgi:hypothetical protein
LIEDESALFAPGRLDNHYVPACPRRGDHVLEIVFHVAAVEPELTRQAGGRPRL